MLLLSFCLQAIESEIRYNYNFDTYSESAIHYTAAFRFAKAREQVTLARRLYPSSNIPVWVENYIDFIRLLNSEDNELYKEVRKQKEARWERFKNGDPNSPYYLFCQAQFKLQWSLIHLKFRDYMTGFREARSAFEILRESQQKFPNFIPTKAGMGVMNVLIGSIPDNYQWIARMLGYNGTVEEGLKMLESSLQVAINDPSLFWLEEEVVFYLSFIYINLDSGKQRALSFRDNYLKTKNMNLTGLLPIQAYAFSKIAMLTGRNDEAISILQHKKTYPDQEDFTYLTYMLAIAYQNKLSDSCILYFDKFISYPGIRNFRKASIQRKAWQYLINGDMEKYKSTIAQVLSTGQTETDADKQAEIEANTGKVPHMNLLKARLLFDGGYYRQALATLQTVDGVNGMATKLERVEYYYRLARIYDEMGRDSNAINYYNLTIKEGSGLPEYFAANAALKLGNIYEEQKNYAQANLFYKKCMEMKFTEYRNSITQKAKVGYERTKKLMKL
ncbi:MAG: tetratricopeptide repeat protein [Bacteroidales bacterium]